MYFVIALLVIALIITIHEFSHGIVSAFWGLPIEYINIGINFIPRIRFTYKKIPITITPWIVFGHIKVDNTKFDQLNVLKRATILLAGPIANFFTAFLLNLIFRGVENTITLIVAVINIAVSLPRDIITGVLFAEVIGPVGALQYGNEVMSQDLWTGLLKMFLNFSIGLALINILPFPPFDGGRIILEFVTNLFKGKPKIQFAIKVVYSFIAVFTLVAFAFVFIRDIANLF